MGDDKQPANAMVGTLQLSSVDDAEETICPIRGDGTGRCIHYACMAWMMADLDTDQGWCNLIQQAEVKHNAV